MLHYKLAKTIGIRRKFGDKKQIWCFGAGSGLSEGMLREWADKVLIELDGGRDEAETKIWIDGNVGVK